MQRSNARRLAVAGAVTAGLVTGGVFAADAALASGGSGSSTAPPSASGTTAPRPPAGPGPLGKHVPTIDGKISALDGDTLTVTDPDGFSRTIAVTSATKYTKDGASASRSVLTDGSRVHAQGSVDRNHTTLDASSVDVQTKQPTPPAGGPAGAPPAGKPGAAAGGSGHAAPPAPPAGGPAAAPKKSGARPPAPPAGARAPRPAPSASSSR